MSHTVNALHPQPGPVAFIGLCAFGLFIVVRGMLSLPVGSEQWQVGALGFLIVVAGFAFIIGGWLWIQREVTFGPDTIVVRRWLEVLLDRPGRVMPLDAGTRTAIVLENVRSLRLEHQGYPRIQLTLGYWDLRQIRRLVEVIRERAIPLEQYWVGDLPPGTA